MCSKFEGDLADIIRGSGGGGVGNGNTMMASTTEEPVVDPTWQFPSNAMGRRLDGFGDPFPNMQDPLLQDLDTPISPPPFFTTTTNNNITSHISINESNVTNSIFSSMGYEMTCSSVDKLQSGTSIVVASGDMINNNNNSGTSNVRHHVMETQVLQISSPRNTGIKRRKSQAKKVVCIPAPAPVNSSRQSGEVVPSDLWAWRKYGQKPIKGSPYPRGYYRCSSSKGCSARKQVERSRTDPNMLVITYTCEHNHPWPTQRNALAGSTRSSPHTSKNTSSSSSSSALHTSPSSSSFSHPNPIHNTNTTTATTTTTIPKDENEGKKESNSITSSHECGNVKEEETVIIMEQRAEMETHIPPAFATQTYRPTLPDESNYYNHSEDFFAELGEIEADPLNLLFENNEENNNNNNKQSDAAALDPFGFYDWAAENNNDCGGLLLGGEETKGGVQQNP